MDPRARWQSLQAHLSAARFAQKMGDRDRAREEVETALSIDPEFLAARMLRDELDAPPRSPAVSRAHTVTSAAPVASLAASSAKIAQLEARVKQRVQDRHIVVPPPAAKRSMAARPLRIGAAAAAVAAFLAAMSGSKISEPRTLLSRGSVSIASLMDSVTPEPIDTSVALAGDELQAPEQPVIRPAARPAAVPASTPIEPLPQLVARPLAQAPLVATPFMPDFSPRKGQGDWKIENASTTAVR